MTTENDEVHGTVIRSGYDPEPAADPTIGPSDQAPDEGPDDAAEDDASSLYDERYLKPADSAATAQPSLESAEERTGDYEGSADEDEDVIVVDSSDAMAQDETLDSADEETGEAGDLEGLDGERVVPDDMGGQAIAPGATPAADAVMPAHAPVPAHSRMPSDREFGDDTGLAGDPEEMRHRWASIQSSFVDDPRESVADAASFLGEVMTTLLANAEQREHELRGEWDRDDLDTEELRTVLRRYRGFIDRLAAL